MRAQKGTSAKLVNRYEHGMLQAETAHHCMVHACITIVRSLDPLRDHAKKESG